MDDFTFSHTDLEDINAQGLSPDAVNDQLRLFSRGVSAPELIAPCTLNNGVTVLDSDSFPRLEDIFRQAIDLGRITKFVPASGAATRMFKELIKAHHNKDKKNPASNPSVVTLIDNISRFACHDDLVQILKKNGLNPDELIANGGHTAILEHLLTPRGLGYASLPKGLIPFHRYQTGSTRQSCSHTAFEEHLAEAAELFAGRDNCCRLHFTVPPGHKSTIKEHIHAAGEHIFKRYGVKHEVTFSTQHPDTDTIAATKTNTPFRNQQGRLVFRPGGHGALLKNLDHLKGDIVFIKNIDNIACEPVRRETAPAIAAMCGLLIDVQQKIFTLLERLASNGTEQGLIEKTGDWASKTLNFSLDDTIMAEDPDAAKKRLMTHLNRPLRVCGMVRNVGEPGGGPFWVKDTRGEISGQIIESAQVDMNNSSQKKIWQSSTHFNPVIIACAVRDFRGRPFPLADYSDPRAAIITEKSMDGQSLKALEHPGLWNGAMTFWNTIFVELPPAAFNPVKTLFDLLREGHYRDGADANR